MSNLNLSTTTEHKEVVKNVTIENYSNLENKINSITKYQTHYIKKILTELSQKNPENANIICIFIINEQNEINIKESTKEWKIKILVLLSKYLNNKSFREITKEDILDYLNSSRKPESIDPRHKSIGTWNNRQLLFLKFFKWLYNPDLDTRKRPTPICMQGIKQLPRKEKSAYEATDLWTKTQHMIFLKYCPSIRDRCYHAMAIDMSARPHEILNLKISQIVFKIAKGGKQYAEVQINGKTGSRVLPLFSSIPYVKEWLLNHPTRDNPNSWLYISQSNNKNKNIGQRLARDGLLKHYREYYRDKYFPKLLEDDTIPDSDKSQIRDMLLKPWTLYVQRHGALTEKSKILKEHNLRNHAGWSITSKMPQVYIHYFGNESSNSLLEAYGIEKGEEKNIVDSIIPKNCPNCNEVNRSNARFCIRCKMILTYDEYTQTQEDIQNERKENEELKEKEKIKDDVLMNLADEIMKLKDEVEFLKSSNKLNTKSPS